MKRLETRGPEVGICNLCGQMQKLTEDHIPPKGVPRVGQVYLDRLSETLGAEKATRAARYFQRGVKYRSICAKCNNELLGKNLDPALIQFCKDAQEALVRNVYLPTDVRVQQNKLFCAVIGHLLAHGLGSFNAGPFSGRKREYFLSPDQSFPADLRLYYWVYPYQPQIVGRFLIRKEAVIGQDGVLFSVMKFFPIGWLCSLGDLNERDAAMVSRVDQLATSDIEDSTVLRVSPSLVPPSSWPEAPGSNGMVLHNSLGTVARPRQ